MSDQERGGVIKLALAGGLLYLWVTGSLVTLMKQLTGGLSGAPVGTPFSFRGLVTSSATRTDAPGLSRFSPTQRAL